ncbi:hypothetical protein OTC26_007375 [Streptomyces tirandamycinicus]|uniref:hypothetical protein n=1 Tax=Streptomyces tirandamycinicus TaxID=2174846 RepID=UPI00226E6AD7|nr:hypothetical protein [Streptomyces tirandamycinicus]MCY0982223.1 hypothetical protein [Streptomyces tirandamycinicus]
MPEAVTGVLDGAMDVVIVGLGLCCVWLGCRALLRPNRPPECIRGPVSAVRVWGLGYVLLGISLAMETVTLTTGGEPGWTGDVIRWVAGPLVVGSIVAALAARWWHRHRVRSVKGGRQA